MEKEDIFVSAFEQNQLSSFKDVTKEFFEALEGLLERGLIGNIYLLFIDLSLGELVHDSSFSLEDSISALEVGFKLKEIA